MKKLLVVLSVIFGVDFLAIAGSPKTVGDLTIDGQAMTINGVVNYFPSTAPASTSIAVRSSTGAITYQSAVTDPVRENSYNVFTSSNVFDNYGLVFEELSSIPTPPSGKRWFGAKPDGFYQKDSSGGESLVGTGGGGSSSSWTDDSGVVYTTATVVIGTDTTTSPSANTVMKVGRGSATQMLVTTSSTSFQSVGRAQIINAGTWTVTNTHFDFSVATITLPSFSSYPGFLSGQIWLNTSSNTIYSGNTPVSSAGSGSYTGWSYSAANQVITSTNGVVIGTVPVTVAAGTKFQVNSGNSPLLQVTSSSTTFSNVGYFSLTNATFSVTATQITGSTTTAVFSTDQDNLNLFGGYEIYRASASTDVNITGLANGTSGREVSLVNVGTTTISFSSEHTSSQAQNRFFVINPLELFQIVPGEFASFWYDGILQRWIRKND